MFFLDYVQLDKDNVEKHTRILHNKIYSRIPESKCLGCPMTNGEEVVAECCKKASPPLYYSEFINVYKNIEKNWSKEKRKELLYKCFEAILNTETEKPCVLLDGNKCSIYKWRWTNCRTYGMIPDEEWVERAKLWIREALRPKFMEVKKVKRTSKSKLGGVEKSEWVEMEIVDEDGLTEYLDTKLFQDEFNPDKINEILKEDWQIDNFKVYDQCTNIELERDMVALDEIYEDVRKVEKSFVQYDIDEDDTNITYLQFHMYMLIFVLGDEKVKSLVQMRDSWPNDQKEAFLKDIKNNLDNLVA